MATDHVVTREQATDRGRYLIDRDGAQAELTYRVISPAIHSADHTLVPDSFRGTGAGVALVARMVADARAEGFRIRAVCPFVKAQQQKHPDWADAFA
jgi:predicted GNAT family acetyltransferase